MVVNKGLLVAAVAVVCVAGAALFHVLTVVREADEGPAFAVKRFIGYELCEDRRIFGIDPDEEASEEPHLAWPGTTPDRVGMAGARLDVLRAALARHNTKAFLVARNGRLAYEWYACGAGPNERQSLAALAKAVVAGPALLAALTERRLSLQDPVWRFVPSWRNEPKKSRITIFDLATHSSGLDDVYFAPHGSGLTGWKKRYREHIGERFRIAIDRAPVLAEPRTRYRYSGLGYYVLAYALTRSLQGTDHPDIRALYRDRIARPLGIPDTDWRINYGRVDHDGATDLYAMGSGAALTARAVARIGQLVLDAGYANGRALIAPSYVKQAISNAGLPPVTGDDGKPAPSIGIAWWVNAPRVFRSLPEDAAIGAGANHQILLVVPSLDLVAVRLGGSLTGNHWGGPFWSELEEHFFRPLMAAVIIRERSDRPLIGALGDPPAQ